MGELVDPGDLKSPACSVSVRLRLLVPNFFLSVYSAARLALLVWDEAVRGSNPFTPTTYSVHLEA